MQVVQVHQPPWGDGDWKTLDLSADLLHKILTLAADGKIQIPDVDGKCTFILNKAWRTFSMHQKREGGGTRAVRIVNLNDPSSVLPPPSVALDAGVPFSYVSPNLNPAPASSAVVQASSLQPNWRGALSPAETRHILHLTRRAPAGYMDHAVDFGAHDEPAGLKHIFRYLASLPPGTRCTAGIAGTDHGVNGGPSIERGLVSPNSGHYPASAGWDASWTHALVFGLDTLSDAKLRQLETAITAKINALPNLTSVATSGGGQGPYTQGPMRLVYLNRLVPGVSLDAARAATSTAKCAPGEKRKCDKCGADRKQRGPCPGQQCADERRAKKARPC